MKRLAAVLLAIAAALLVAIPAVAVDQFSATTAGVSDVTTTGATLKGTIRSSSLATYHFEYGPTASYGATTAPTAASSPNGALPVQASVKGLAPSAVYH